MTPRPSPYSAPDSTDPKDLYLHLLKRTLTGLAQPKPMSARLHPYGGLDLRPLPDTQADLWKRYRGEEIWPADAFTMIGVDRLENVQACVEDVLR